MVEETTRGETGVQTGEAAAAITRWVEHAATGIELLAVVIIVAVILTGTVLYVFRILAHQADVNHLQELSSPGSTGFAAGIGNPGGRGRYSHCCPGADVRERTHPRAAGADSHFLGLVARG